MAIFFVVTAVVMIGGLAVIPAIQEVAEAQSTTHSQSCEPGRGASFQSCSAPRNNPSNANSICNSGREFGANLTGSNC